MTQCAWVTGAGGLIGSHFVRAAARWAPDWRVRALTRDQIDLCDFPAVERAFRSDQPELVIHCAALTRSPACQTDPDRAWKMNVQVTKHLAELAEVIPLVFFSTDLVFDGQDGNYDELATPNPLSVYAETKLAAEQEVLANSRHIVIRTSLNAGPSPTKDRGFDEQLRVAWERGEKTRLFTDEFRAPIAASVTARAVWEIIRQQLTGLFHVAGAQRLSRWEIGSLVAARYSHLRPQLEPSSLRDYSGPPRSPDTSLDCRKIQRVLSFPLPGFPQWFSENRES
jgi:dTDP-4-dehydrorhamnose reductase